MFYQKWLLFSNLPIHDKPSAATFFVSGLSDDEWGNVKKKLFFLGRSVGWSIYIDSTVTKISELAILVLKSLPLHCLVRFSGDIC